MYSWIVGRAVRALVRRLNAGDVRTILRTFADDAHLVFPGDSSFAGDHHGKQAIEAWLNRFLELGPNLVVQDVGVAGAPWNMRVFFRFTDSIALTNGYRYENEGMEYLLIRLGKTREQRVYLDTQKVAELDAQLAGAAA
jgi:ketosteroid isomerase-like protein